MPAQISPLRSERRTGAAKRPARDKALAPVRRGSLRSRPLPTLMGSRRSRRDGSGQLKDSRKRQWRGICIRGSGGWREPQQRAAGLHSPGGRKGRYRRDPQGLWRLDEAGHGLLDATPAGKINLFPFLAKRRHGHERMIRPTVRLALSAAKP